MHKDPFHGTVIALVILIVVCGMAAFIEFFFLR
jgi:hypothetical protein